MPMDTRQRGCTDKPCPQNPSFQLSFKHKEKLDNAMQCHAKNNF